MNMFSNSGNDVDKQSGITCSAKNCYYNTHGSICTAKHIDVGTKNATSPSETECDTFKPCDCGE